MGSRKSGNRMPRQKLPADQKSRTYQVRLDPKKPEHLELIDALEGYLSPSNTPERAEEIRELIQLGLAAKGKGEYVERQIKVSPDDVLDIKEVVYYIMDKLESGELAIASGGKTRRKKTAELPELIRNNLDKYLGAGITADEDD